MVGSAAAAFPRDISAELVKVLGCVPVSVLLAFMASTERPPHTSARAESGVVLGAREVAEVRKFVSTGRPGFGCSNRPSNQLVHRNDYQSGEHDSDSFLDLTCSEEADYGQETKEPAQSQTSTHIRKCTPVSPRWKRVRPATPKGDGPIRPCGCSDFRPPINFVGCLDQLGSERASLIGRHRIVVVEFDVDLGRFPQRTVGVLHRGGPDQNVVAVDAAVDAGDNPLRRVAFPDIGFGAGGWLNVWEWCGGGLHHLIRLRWCGTEDSSCANLVRDHICAGQMAPPAGIEPATNRLEGGCSIR